MPRPCGTRASSARQAGPSVDRNGNLYVAAGDGIFDFSTGGLDYGDTLMKISLTGSDLDMVDYFTPYNQAFLDQHDLGSGGSCFFHRSQVRTRISESLPERKEQSISLIKTA